MSDSTLVQLIIFLDRVKSPEPAAAGQKEIPFLLTVHVPADDCISNGLFRSSEDASRLGRKNW